MPTVWHIESNHIAVVHPYRAEGTAENVDYIMTVYDWNKGNLSRSAHIKLWTTPFHKKLFMINMLNYECEKDKVRIVFANIYLEPEVPACKVIEFTYANAMEQCKGASLAEAIHPKYMKEFTFDTEVKSMVALHLHPDAKTSGTLFLLCDENYFTFTRKNAHSDLEMS